MPTMSEVVVPDAFFANHLSGANAPQFKLSAEDRLDILDCTNRFEWAFDARRMDELSALLTDDVIIDHVFGYREGKRAVMEMMRGMVTSTGLRHQATNASIFVDDDGQICVLSYLFVISVEAATPQAAPPPSILGHALVTDVVRREGNAWKIARRTFEQMSVPESYLPDASARRALEVTASQRAVDRGGAHALNAH